MDFDLSDDQRLLKDSVDRFTLERYGFETRRRYQASERGWSEENWRQFAELGLLGLPFAEEEGGFGGSPAELGLVMEAFGRALVVEPFFPSVVLCGALLRHCAEPGERADLVGRLIAGQAVAACGLYERQGRYALNDIRMRAVRDGDCWRLDGAKVLCLGGGEADVLLVTARTAGQERERHGIGLFQVDASSAGVSRRAYPTQDGLRAADIELAGARGVLLGREGEALPGIERAEDEAVAALCAEAVGVMQVMYDMTVDYLKTRKQFGRAIGDNQALQHRAVDMYVSLEQARSMALYATMMAGSDDATERRRAIHAAKVQIGQSGRHVGQEAVQLHGGIAVTMEYGVGHYFKRMTMIERSFGDTQTHLSALARLGGLIAA